MILFELYASRGKFEITSLRPGGNQFYNQSSFDDEMFTCAASDRALNTFRSFQILFADFWMHRLKISHETVMI